MKTNKIIFAGVMGAILMSAGANAATTSVATKGYVDQQVGIVEKTITDKGYVTISDVENVIDEADLSQYQTVANMASSFKTIADADKAIKYPSVAAVVEAINDTLGLDSDQLKELQDLLAGDGLATQIAELSTAVTSNDVTKDGTVAKRIADALKDYTPTEDLLSYQEKSTADLQIGTIGGVFRDMTAAEKAALASGINATKVEAYDALAGEDGAVAKLQTAVDELNGENGTIETITNNIEALTTVIGDADDGLVADVKKNAANIETNADNIAQNTEDIEANATNIATLSGSPVFKPAECTNEACVLMVKGTSVFWTPVTQPVDDTTTTEAAE